MSATRPETSADLLQEIIAASEFAIAVFENQQQVFANAAILHLFGCEESNLASHLPEEISTYIFRKENWQESYIAQQFLSNTTRKNVVYKTACKNAAGEELFCSFKVMHVGPEAAGRIQLEVVNLSERVAYEQSVRESQARLSLLSTLALEGIVFLKEDEIIDCNDQFAQLFGFDDCDSIVGKSIANFLESDELNKLKSVVGSKDYRQEVRAFTHKRKLLFLEASAHPTTIEQEDLWVLMCYNITDRKRAEQTTQQNIELYKSLTENSPNAIFILIDRKIEFVNSGGIRLLEFQDEDDMYATDFLDFVVEHEREKVGNLLSLVREGEETEYQEIILETNARHLLDAGIKCTLTVYEGRPSIQVTVTNLQESKELLKEKTRAKLAEELNLVLKKEIVKHKITQRELQQAKNFARDIIESSIDMIIAVDTDGKITEFNNAAAGLFGYTKEEVYGKQLSDLYASEREYAKVNESLSEKRVFSGEIKNRRKNGEIFTCFLSASEIYNDKDQRLGSMGVSRDISAIKKAQEKLQKSEERYRDIYENSTDFILSIDKKGGFIFANKAFQNAIGYNPEELKKLTIYDMLKESGKRIAKRNHLFKDFVSENLQVQMLAKNGEEVFVEGNTSVRYKAGAQHSVRAILRDVTQSRKSQREALAQKAKLESIFNSTENMMMWTLDKKMNLTSFNINFVKTMAANFGINIGLGHDYCAAMKSIVDLNDQGILKIFEKAIKGSPQQFELPVLDKNGNMIWLQHFLNPVQIGNEKFQEISCLAYDITERKDIDQRIRGSLKEKEVLLQEVHHRVKNNLQIISSILNLQSGYVKDENTLEILRESQDRIRSMSAIHETLYQTTDFSSIAFTDYLRTLAGNLITSYRVQSEAVQLETDFDTVNLSLDQAIPCGLIVNELVTNSMKYAFADQTDPKIWMEVKLNNKTITLKVADNGVGLPTDFAYEEADSIGVQLVYTLAEQLDATVAVDSEQGTSFLFTFEML